ncbi:MAG: hydrogenase maturation protease [Nitrososphaeria archaeon]
MPASYAVKKLKDFLSSSKKFVFVCIGNELRGDDHFGIYFGRKLLKTRFKSRTILAYSTPEAYLDEVLSKVPDVVVFVDAVQAGEKPGAIVVEEISIGSSVRVGVSTHSIPIEAVALLMQSMSSKALKFVVVGVQMGHVEFGKGMSKEVVESANLLLNTIKGL